MCVYFVPLRVEYGYFLQIEMALLLSCIRISSFASSPWANRKHLNHMHLGNLSPVETISVSVELLFETTSFFEMLIISLVPIVAKNPEFHFLSARALCDQSMCMDTSPLLSI